MEQVSQAGNGGAVNKSGLNLPLSLSLLICKSTKNTRNNNYHLESSVDETLVEVQAAGAGAAAGQAAPQRVLMSSSSRSPKQPLQSDISNTRYVLQQICNM